MADALPPEMDDAPDERFRSIGEAAVETGVKPHILRYWEECFQQLRPMKRAGGRRYYRRADMDLIRQIDDLVNRQGYTFAGARAVLAAQGLPEYASAEHGEAVPVHGGLTSAQSAGLLSLRADLAAMLAQVRRTRSAA